VSSLVALILFLNLLNDCQVNATQVAVVVAGALINVAKFPLVASTFAQINTFQAVVQIEATKVNVCQAIVTVSLAVGCVAKANTALQAT